MAKKIFPLIFLFGAFLALPFAACADSSASFAFTPALSSVSSGSQFSVGVAVNASAAINAAQGTVTFPASQLKVIGISKASSIFQFWPQDPAFSNTSGTITFAGGMPSPGFTGTGGLLFVITFQALDRGAATINITQGAILANDGAGTNVAKGMPQGTYAVTVSAAVPVKTLSLKVDHTPPTISAIKETSQGATDPQPSFIWSGTDPLSGIQGYRVRVGNGSWLSPVPATAGQITLPVQTPGKYLLTVEARDFAGNTANATTTFTVVPIAFPVIVGYPHSISKAPPAGTVNQIVTISGRASEAASVILSLSNGNNLLKFTAPVSKDGSWQATYSGTLSSGRWSLTAQAVDARGALSAETPSLTIQVNGFIENLIQFLAVWGALVLVIITFLALIAAFILAVHERLKRYHLK